ncbi:MAG TPA: DUF4139 domain-containing protein [Chitinophagales bacterium]|nr:DUF4139 domain-containing protein [Chitinophagales bacterium]HNK10954.1 DUF4139 domain-containing protein [Chitinophagales bacterium]HNL56662.1 DUF4139 domain-containing protein [Chitinophagales bacterium]HNN24820.1 DUF4139 domain-containing protein [Chitinophagales bacterium]
MKHLFFIPSMLMVLFANAININDSKITDVTVFRNYAKETRMASAQIPEGNSEVIISNVSTYLDENSLQIATKGNVKILSVSSKLNYLIDKTKSSQVIKLTDSIEMMNDDVSWWNQQSIAFQDELKLLDENRKLANDKSTFTAAQVKELAELYRNRALELRKYIFDLNKKQKLNNDKIAKLKSQIAVLNGNQNMTVKEIILKINAKSAGLVSFKCSYIVSNAYWTPIYDIRAKNNNSPLQLDCRAKVVQNTGYDWKDVRLTLSTANPSANHNRPVLYPIYVDFFQPDYYEYKLKTSSYGEAAQMMNMAAPAKIDIARSTADDEFEEGLKATDNNVTIQEGDMAVEYNIETLQDVESDNKEHIVAIQEIEMPALYAYHTVPKLDMTAYLLARVTDWSKYNLLAGEANIFFDDNYVGKSYLNPNVSADTLLISLGRDEKINIKRVKLNDYSAKKLLSGNIKETKAFETTIKNNKNTSIEIELLDQFPISKNSQIEVTLEEANGATITEEYGKLVWKIKLQANESKKVKLIYTVKYPKDKQIKEKNS